MATGGDPNGRREHSPIEAVRSELSGQARDVVQARDISGGVHFHQSLDERRPVPRQLPADVPGFVNRARELEWLDGFLVGDGVIEARLCVIAGTPGVGKTSLALHWSHCARASFPEGQLYVNMHGYDPIAPLGAYEVLSQFIEALGISAESIPTDLEARTSLYRTLLADKRLLVVLDNVASVSQVRPLIPGAEGCLVLITSRSRLSGLVARDGAKRVSLAVLDELSAIELVHRITDDHRPSDRTEDIAELARMCAHLPLALRIAAERAASRPRLPLDALMADLREESSILDALYAEESEESDAVRTVFGWSYRRLSTEDARAFRLLSLHPTPEFSTYAAAALVGLSMKQSRRILDSLVGAHLLEQTMPDRYQFHDLLRVFAAEKTDYEEASSQRLAALRRLVDFYVQSAYLSDRLLHPQRMPIDVDASASEPRRHHDATEALEWFDAEHRILLAIQNMAKGLQWHGAVWQLAWVLDTFHHRKGRLQDQLSTWQAGLTAANSLESASMQTLACRRLGVALARVGRYTEALDRLSKALDMSNQIDDLLGEAHAHRALARAWELQGDYQRALHHSTVALQQYQTLSIPVWEADALNLVGWYYARLGNFPDAQKNCEAALKLHRENEDRDGEANTLDSLGYVAHHSKNYTYAISCYQQALTLFQHLGRAYEEANTLDRMARTWTTIGKHDLAHAAWRNALELYRLQNRATNVTEVENLIKSLSGGTLSS